MSQTLFITDTQTSFPSSKLNCLSFDDYLSEYPKANESKVRIINLCNLERYLSQGYYCSLLAEARQHQVLPSVKTINDLRNNQQGKWFDLSVLGKKETDSKENRSIIICMGKTEDSQYKKLALQLFQTFPAPLLKVDITFDERGLRVSTHRCSLDDLNNSDRAFCFNILEEYAEKSWRINSSGKKFRWDLAMLINPKEDVPPSDKDALARFVKAGEKLGIRVHQVTASELSYISQYDALFIRETTAIDHHTYRLAREADQQGMIVIDDPDSILRCCNKVFLHDSFNYKKIPSLKTHFMRDASAKTLDEVESMFSYPIVLKMPESSFSKGVFKAKDRKELEKISGELLSDSALLLAQEYVFTDYDWRIGVLNGRALYACRYYMAKDHWQIYNHNSTRFFSGGFDVLPTFEVPSHVLNTAMKAAAVVGNGLYGVDIKSVNGPAYVMEVNDNPSLDHEVEDMYLGDELYMQIMSEFLRRLEARGK